MKGKTFAEYIRKKTRTNETTFSDADIVTYANAQKDEIAQAIVANVDEDYFDMENVRDLEAGERGYTLPNNMLRHIKYVQVKLDGEKYVRANEVELSYFDELPVLEESYVTENFSDEHPKFFIKGREIVILSGSEIQAVADGIKIICEVYPEDITEAQLSNDTTDLSVPSSTTTHALPRATHKYWAMMVIVDYKESRDKPVPLTDREKALRKDSSAVYEDLTPRNANRATIVDLPYNDGHQY